MLLGVTLVPPTPSLGGPGGVFLGVKNYFPEASPHATEGFGHVFFGPASSAQLGVRFSLLASFLTFGHLNIPRVLEGS